MFKVKNITVFYLVFQFFGLFLALLPENLIPIRSSLLGIFFYHVSGVFIFMLGYLLPPVKLKDINYSYKLNVTTPFLIFAVLISVFGIVVSYLQLVSFFSLSEYIAMFLSNDSHTSDVRGLGAHSENGGLSGILKMFAYAPLAIYLITVAWQYFFSSSEPLNETELTNKKRLKWIVMFSLVLSLVKVFFWLDRLTLGAIILVNIYLFFNKKKSTQTYLIYLTFFVIVIVIANAVSANRLEGYNILDFLILYFKLGLVNFDDMVKTLQGHTYGFSSFLSPLTFIFGFLGISIDFKTTHQFEWQDAQYMNSYLHEDFGYFSLLAYFLLGWFMRNSDYFTHKRNGLYVSTYFMILFGLATFWVVPITNAVEYWLMLVIAFFSSTLCIKRLTVN